MEATASTPLAPPSRRGKGAGGLGLAAKEARSAFSAAMDDDFNTSVALAVVDGLVGRLNEYAAALGGARATAAQLQDLRTGLAGLEELAGVLGIALEAPEAADELDASRRAEIEALVAQREAARTAKNWAEADRIRDELTAMGIALKDAKNPTTGEIETTWEIAR